jgi:hypothetical protein
MILIELVSHMIGKFAARMSPRLILRVIRFNFDWLKSTKAVGFNRVFRLSLQI